MVKHGYILVCCSSEPRIVPACFSGTLLVKPLGPLVNAKDIIEGEFITSLLVVVPK